MISHKFETPSLLKYEVGGNPSDDPAVSKANYYFLIVITVTTQLFMLSTV
jgi:protein involved in ribonucleotide reduction